MSSETVLEQLRKYESRNVTFLEPDGSWPIVWKRAKGVAVWDEEGHRFLDLTAAFGVAAAGHANPAVVRAGQRQMSTLLHAMGDVHPHALKARLACELSRLTFERWTLRRRQRERDAGKTLFCNSGFEAVEAALKTALLATRKPGVIAFEGGYHGLGYGALSITHRQHFRFPFHSQLREFGHFAPFPEEGTSHTTRRSLEQVRTLLKKHRVGAILLEPLQARGGIRVPPSDFLPALRRLCDEQGVVLILDEIYTGFGRTGKWFACEHSAVVPDLICLGKALTGGFPLSACVGRSDLMDRAWPASSGEAIHTSTFLGHPVGCAMALAQIAEIQRLGLVERSAKLGSWFLKKLSQLQSPKPDIRCVARGLGLMTGIELRHEDHAPATAESLRVLKAMLHRRFILLPEGEFANTLSFTPPLVISSRDLDRTLNALKHCLE